MKIAILLIALLVGGCGTGEPEGTRVEKKGYNVIVIDGCEYIEITFGTQYASNYAYSLTHKGNCTNKEHKP